MCTGEVPNRLVCQPACITLLVTVIISSKQLVRSCYLCPNRLTSPLGLMEGKCIAAQAIPIVEYNP